MAKCWDPRSCLLTDNIARVCPDLEQNCPVFTIDFKIKKSLQLKNFLQKEVCMWSANTLAKELDRLNGAEAL